MRISRIDSLAELSPRAWNALQGTDNPFLRYEFLAALENHGCVGEDTGWIPHFLTAERDDTLIGAVPAYIKYHSFGEFVFDWAWASAYQNSGRPYYPKLVVAVPFTPITGPRILTAQASDSDKIAEALIQGTLDHARDLGVSSLHWLFINDRDAPRLEKHGLMRRSGCQFHWSNPGYGDFADFLAGMSSEKRKKIKRERRHVAEAGIEFEILSGAEIQESHWSAYYDFYQDTFWKKGNAGPLTYGFYMALGRDMPDNTLLIMARHNGRYVAGASFLRGRDTLYGRHWGCAEEFHSLHFETCYYQAIDYCIAQGLPRFEAGAQGEHKISRGFMPTPTWSAHWIQDRRFGAAIKDFLHREDKAVCDYIHEARRHSPYKTGAWPQPGAVPGEDRRTTA
ncbi:MAG: GNAT family N-acetyltransferase [Gammaproteobacteria bacterium]